MLNKETLRKDARRARESLSAKYREEASLQACTYCQKLIGQAAGTVMLYYPFGCELDVKPLFTHLWNAGKTVLLPRINGGQIVPMEYRAATALETSSFGVPEPVESAVYNPRDIDVCIVPGLAFDRERNRIGFGAGHYDRFLPRSGAKKIGICFAAQMVDRIPTDAHDQRMDFVVTEKGVIGCG